MTVFVLFFNFILLLVLLVLVLVLVLLVLLVLVLLLLLLLIIIVIIIILLVIASDVINVTLVITGEECTDGEYSQLWEKLSKTVTNMFV